MESRGSFSDLMPAHLVSTLVPLTVEAMVYIEVLKVGAVAQCFSGDEVIAR